MNFEKPSLTQTYIAGDVRALCMCLTQFTYTIEEVSDVINFYELSYEEEIPEVEHIEVLLTYYPNKINISYYTLIAIKNSFPERLAHIINTNNKKNI